MAYANEPGDRTLVLLAVAHGGVCACIAVAAFKAIGGWHMQDLRLYFGVSRDVMRGLVPYRDFPLEYPPLALLPLTLPALVAPARPLGMNGYLWSFVAMNAIWSSLLAYCVMRLARARMDRSGVLATFALHAALGIIGAPLFLWRFDLFPALLLALAMIAVLDDRPGLAGILTGAGIATKIYPAVLLPILWAWYSAAGDRRAIARLTVGAVAVPLALTAPLLILAPDGVLAFVAYHQQRGLQLESVASGVLMVGRLAGLNDLSAAQSHGAIHLVTAAGEAIKGWLIIALIASMALITFCASRRFRRAGGRDGATLVAFALAAVLVFMVTNRVLSPQYLAWLLPFTPFLRRGQAVAAVAAFALTIFIFPFHYESLIRMEPLAILALNGRNVVLVGLTLSLLLRARRPPEFDNGHHHTGDEMR